MVDATISDPLAYLLDVGFSLDYIQDEMKRLGLTTDEMAAAAQKIIARGENPLEGIEDARPVGGGLDLFAPLTDFQEEEARWLIPGWLPEGQITLLAGDGGVGKTSIWVDLAASVSAGKPSILDASGSSRAPGTVLICTTEDSISKKLLRKLREAGSMLENIRAMNLAADKSGQLKSFKFGSEMLSQVIRAYRPTMTIFDPIQGFIPPLLNMGSRNAMRDCLAPLITLGEEVGATFLLICHTNKRKGAYGRDRIADSADLWDISRSVIMAGYTEDQGVRYLSNEKNNYAELQETVLFTIDGQGQVVKTGATWKRDRDFVQEETRATSVPVRGACRDFLVHALENEGGGLPTSELEAKARDAGFSFSAIRSAKGELKRDGVISAFHTGGNGGRVWHTRLTELPASEPVPFATPSGS